MSLMLKHQQHPYSQGPTHHSKQIIPSFFLALRITIWIDTDGEKLFLLPSLQAYNTSCLLTTLTVSIKATS